LAKSGLDTAIMAVNHSDYIPYIVSRGLKQDDGDIDLKQNQTFDWIWKLETGDQYAINDGYEISDYRNLMDMNLFPTWCYVWDSEKKLNDKKPIIGRYAYVAITNTSKLDPNSVANHEYCNYKPSGEDADETCEDGNEIKDLKSNKHIRKGASVAELWYDSSKDYFKSAGGLSAQVIANKYLEKKKKDSSWTGWNDWDEFISDFG